MGHWRRLTCNLPTRAENAAITEAEWYGAQVNEDIPAGERVTVGLDLAFKHDTTAAVPLWIRDAEYRLLGKSTILTPPRDGNSLHPDLVENALLKIHERNPINRVVMDSNKAEWLISWIEDTIGCEVVDRGQSNKLACEDYDRFTEALRKGWLKHTEDRELTRHVLNAIARPATYGDLRFDRPSQSRLDRGKQDLRVIDGLVAAAMAHTSEAQEISVGDAGFAFA